MEPEGSVTGWMHRLVAGDDVAANELWGRYVERLQHLARRHLGARPRPAVDEEDVVVSVFNIFCQGARAGRFPALHDRDNLWRLLVVMTARKAADHAKFAARRQQLHAGDHDQDLLMNLVGREPSPEFAALLTEECEVLLRRLSDDTLRNIALLRLDGYSQQEIADQLGISLRSVERKIQRIRLEWGEVVEASEL